MLVVSLVGLDEAPRIIEFGLYPHELGFSFVLLAEDGKFRFFERAEKWG